MKLSLDRTILNMCLTSSFNYSKRISININHILENMNKSKAFMTIYHVFDTLII